MANEILDLALGYPYLLPKRSYIVDGRDVRDMSTGEIHEFRSGRVPVLAVGSNQSPEQIVRKFSHLDCPPIPCERCEVQDFDSVYSAHVTGYGSIASCLHPSPGTRVTLFVNWLHEDHMPRMHETELGNENYCYAALEDIRIVTEFGLELETVYFYCSNAGAFAPNGAPVPLAEVPAQNRQWQARSQREMQNEIHAMTAPDLNFEGFITSSVSDTDERNRRKAVIREFGMPFSHKGLNIINL